MDGFDEEEEEDGDNDEQRRRRVPENSRRRRLMVKEEGERGSLEKMADVWWRSCTLLIAAIGSALLQAYPL